MGTGRAFVQPQNFGEMNLEQREQFWTDRFRLCLELCSFLGSRDPYALHAGRTRTIEQARKVYQSKYRDIVGCRLVVKIILRLIVWRFLWKSYWFFRGILREIRPYWTRTRIDYVCDLYCGPALFPRMLLKERWFFKKKLALYVSGVELVSELAIAAQKLASIEVYQGSPHLALQNLDKGRKDAFTVIRGFLHSPDQEVAMTCQQIQRILMTHGIAVVCELLEEDKPPERETNQGTYYRTTEQYDKYFSPRMKRVYRSRKPIDNEGDPCRVLIYEMVS